MALIRQSDAERIAKDAIVLDLGDLKRQGDELVTRAHARATLVMQEAQREREALVATGHAEGFAKGLAEGHAVGRAAGLAEGRAAALESRTAELARIEAGWKEALGTFLSEREALVASARDDLLRLAIEIAKGATARLLVADPGLTAGLMAEAVASAARASRLVICVHPEDEPICREALPALMARFPECEHAEVRPDFSLARGSVIVRTPGGGEVDGSASTRLERIARALVPGTAESGGSQERAA